MDITLSILAGFGLRLFLASTTDVGSANRLAMAALGLWEGIVVHQISGRSLSPHLDHILAFVLRIMVDLLVTKDLRRMAMVVLWSVFGVFASELVTPHDSLRAAVEKEVRRRERRHKHSRSVPAAVPIIAVPLPPRVRAYRQPGPEQGQLSEPPYLPPIPPPQSSTPLFPMDRPPTPPSFFLQENTILSPSPKPVQLQLQTVEDEGSPRGALPVRPRSGLATMFDQSPESGSPLPVPMHLPTPPESAQSGNPSDGPIDANDTYHEHVSRFETQLSTIHELSSPEDGVTPPERHDADFGSNVHLQQQETTIFLASVPIKPQPESIFLNPFAATSSDVLPLPVRMGHQEPLWQIQTPIDATFGFNHGAQERMNPIGDYREDSDPDELRTPGVRATLMMETDNEHETDPLQTPIQLATTMKTQDNNDSDAKEQLSPLGLNVRSALDNDNEYNRVSDETPPSSASYSHDTYPNQDDGPPEDEYGEEEENDTPMPGSLSHFPILQPPLPPSGPLFPISPPSPPPESTPPPASPATIISDTSAISTLSTRVPTTLFKRAEELRKKAREEESLRSDLDLQRKRAESEGRTHDALRLRIRIRDMDAEAQKLHEKAARRYFVGE